MIGKYFVIFGSLTISMLLNVVLGVASRIAVVSWFFPNIIEISKM